MVHARCMVSSKSNDFVSDDRSNGFHLRVDNGSRTSIIYVERVFGQKLL